jgi:nucleoside-diphosphate-sugar epimerase
MVKNAKRLMGTPSLSTAVVHPAMVYHADGGVFDRFLGDAREGRAIEIWGSPDTRWPLIHRSDLARAYCDLLERPELTGHFNAVAEQGVRVGDIARTIAQAFDNTLSPSIASVDEVVAQHGAWAKGPTLDQQMSAAKLRAATGWTPEVVDYRRSDLFET